MRECRGRECAVYTCVVRVVFVDVVIVSKRPREESALDLKTGGGQAQIRGTGRGQVQCQQAKCELWRRVSYFFFVVSGEGREWR